MTTFLSQNVERLQAPEIDYGAVAPLLIVLGAACLSVLFEAFLPKAQRWAAQVVLVLLTLAAAGAGLVLYASADATPDQGKLTFAGTIAVDRPVIFLWGTLLLLGKRAAQHEVGEVDEHANGRAQLFGVIAPGLAPAVVGPFHTGYHAQYAI